MKESKTASCPDCEQEILLDNNPQKGQKITCPNCWAYLEIVSLDPLKLDWEPIELDEAWLTDDEE